VKILSIKLLNKREKKRKEKIHVPAEYQSRLASITGKHNSTRPQTLTLLEEVKFTTYFFSCDKIPVDMNMLVFFLGNCVQTAAKTVVVNRKNQKALAVLYLASGWLRNAGNSGIVPTEFTAEPTTKMKSLKANLVT